VRTRHALRKVPVVVLVVGLLLVVLAIPIKQRCGAPGLSCTSTLDEQGNIHYYYYYYYEVELLGVYLAEIFTGSNIRFYYRSGDDVVKVR
jgi:hypothetical protein